jgi:hypothetical protein
MYQEDRGEVRWVWWLSQQVTDLETGGLCVESRLWWAGLAAPRQWGSSAGSERRASPVQRVVARPGARPGHRRLGGCAAEHERPEGWVVGVPGQGEGVDGELLGGGVVAVVERHIGDGLVQHAEALESA